MLDLIIDTLACLVDLLGGTRRAIAVGVVLLALMAMLSPSLGIALMVFSPFVLVLAAVLFAAARTKT
jgi:hypothetical protein